MTKCIRSFKLKSKWKTNYRTDTPALDISSRLLHLNN